MSDFSQFHSVPGNFINPSEKKKIRNFDFSFSEAHAVQNLTPTFLFKLISDQCRKILEIPWNLVPH